MKSAAKLADRILSDVAELGWPIGQVLGAEPDLLERYGVSRAVFREAVRIVEHRGVARTRRGPGGGLVVTEPYVQAVIDALAFYLFRIGATFDEVFEARLAVEGRVAAATANPATELFVDALNRVSLLYAPGQERLTTLPPHRLHGVPAKLAVGVAAHLARRVVDRSLEPGALIGTETELMDQEGVSRAVFREAVRLLEYHSVAGMRRGPGGGLVVLDPDPAAAVEVVAIYLTRNGVTRGQVAELREAIAAEPAGRVLALIAMVLDRLDRTLAGL